MKFKSETTRLIAKYALILIIFYLLETIANYALRYLVSLPSKTPMLVAQVSAIPFIIMIILNIVAAIIVARDIKNHQLKTNYLIFLTLVLRPLGICLFLISLINQTGKEEVLEVHRS